MYILEFELKGLPRTANARLHWRARHAENKKWMKEVHPMLQGAFRPMRPLKRAKLTLTRVSSVSIDSDNLVISFKPIIDALVTCKVLVNDKFENIGMPDYRWEKGKPKQGFVKIRIEEVQ